VRGCLHCVYIADVHVAHMQCNGTSVRQSHHTFIMPCHIHLECSIAAGDICVANMQCAMLVAGFH
jgi:hypothetical protein